MISDHDEDAGGNPQFRWLLGALGVLTPLVLIVWWPGCRQYPPVSSRESLQLVRLLYTACNTRDLPRLTQVKQRLEKAVAAGQVTPSEQQAFRKIIAQARSGAWEGAEKSAFRFAQDQIGQGQASQTAHAHDHDEKPRKKR